MNTDAAAPIQPKFPPVSSLHSIVPVNPSGWVKACVKTYCGAKNVATVISATAKFISRKFIEVLWKLKKRKIIYEFLVERLHVMVD